MKGDVTQRQNSVAVFKRESAHALVHSGCYTRVPHSGWLTDWDQGAHMVGFWGGLSSRLQNADFLHSHVIERGKGVLLGPFNKGYDPNPSLWSNSHLKGPTCYYLRGQDFKIRILVLGRSTFSPLQNSTNTPEKKSDVTACKLLLYTFIYTLAK